MQGHKSTEQTLNSVTYYGGLASLKIVAINPTGEEVKKILGIEELKKEPEYTNITIKNGNGVESTFNKITFYLSNDQTVITDKKNDMGVPIRAKEKITVRLEFLVSDDWDIASTGTERTINSLGISTWQSIAKVKANENMVWFSKNEPLHQARKGEADLLTFMREYLNLGAKEECNFKDAVKLLGGDVTELKQIIKPWAATNEVVVLLGMVTKEDKSYQTVYGRCFSRPTAKTPATKFNKALNEDYGEFKTNYPKSLELSYVIEAVTSDAPDSTTTPAVTSNWV